MLDRNPEHNFSLTEIGLIEPGMCPNFYLTGASAPALEELSFNIAETLETKEVLSFRGLLKHFTIQMPYYADETGARGFMEHLLESISIARDCYDQYRGIIILELSPAWSTNGFNDSLHLFLDFMQRNEQICFVVIVPNSKDDTLFCEFSRCSVWMKVHSQTPSVHQCVSLFCTLAAEQGYRISEEAKAVLTGKLKERGKDDSDNMTAVRQLIKQIVFERHIKQDPGKTIRAEDVMCVSSGRGKNKDRKIGFSSDIR